jgi:multiple sugar transport system permease protein
VVPLSTPGLAACGVVIFVISWPELLIPLIVVSKPEFMTVPVVLAGLVSDYFVFFMLMMAIGLLGLAPTLLLVLVCASTWSADWSRAPSRGERAAGADVQ